MADKSIDQLIAAENILATDLFVLQQSGMAKKLPGQVLLNWLTKAADGHGGIKSIAKLSTSGLADTYRITLADTTTFDFVVTNGRSISSLKKTGTSGLVDTYTVTYNDGTTSTFTVTNGAKGDKGDNAYIWIKYASQEPTASSNSFGDLPDDWMGIYFGTASTAPTDWQLYKWYRIKGEKGDTGEPATIVSAEITYQVGDSGTIIPFGSWSSSVPPVTPGRYLWTRQVLQFNSGAPITSYSVSRFGIDGTGAVSTVAGIAPDENGNVPLDAASVKALALAGGTMEGGINMNGQPLSGLNAPTKDDEPATKGYTDSLKPDLTGYATETDVDDAKTEAVNFARRVGAPHNLLDNSDFTNPVNQRGSNSYSGQGYGIDRWRSWNSENVTTVNSGSVSCTKQLYQCVDPQKIKPNTIYTFAACSEDGTVYYISGQLGEKVQNSKTILEFSGEIPAVWLSGDSYLWAALYEGEYTADNLPVYQPKGYGAELTECMRYYYRFEITGSGLLTSGKSEARIGIPLPMPMRIKPTIINPQITSIRLVSGVTVSPTTTSTKVTYNAGNSLAVSYIFDEITEAINNTPVSGYAFGELSADL